MRVRRDHLTLVFNQLLDRGEERVTLTHPLDEIGDLVTIELADPTASMVHIDLDRSGYANARNRAVLEHGDAVDTDLPDRDAYRNAIVASGIVPIANLDAVTTFLDRYGDPDLMAGHQPVFAGFDTNILPWRVDRILGLRHPDRGVGYVNGFALATGVRDELDWDVKCHDTDPYREAYGEIADAYWSQPLGSGRISRLGLATYREIRDIQQAAELESATGDEAIVAAYDAWQHDVRGQVLLFTNDRNFVELGRAHRVLTQRIELPDELPEETTASWADIEALVYLLTVLFGIIELPGVTLLGVWGGKEGRDWQEERLKLEPRSPSLADALAGSLTVVERHAEVTESR